MDTVETTGKTIEEARAAALQQLQATEDEVEFEVIEEPRKLLGFLGTQGDYHLRATRKGTMATGEAPVETVPEEQPVAEAGAPQVQPINDLASTGAGAVEQVVAQRAIEFLAETTRLMGLHTDVVVVNSEPGEIELEIRGEGLGLLIGRHGATLDALQMLAAVVGNTGLSQGARVVVDAEQYRERRREMLRKMALQQAEKAKESQQEVVIPDLKAFERRIVHLTLKDDPDVETYSEGEGDDRCIVISPRNV
ncbi:MAG: RNA-binding cell elongation regulator Jag/EloR [Armatimonadia bacterium]